MQTSKVFWGYKQFWQGGICKSIRRVDGIHSVSTLLNHPFMAIVMYRILGSWTPSLKKYSCLMFLRDRPYEKELVFCRHWWKNAHQHFVDKCRFVDKLGTCMWERQQAFFPNFHSRREFSTAMALLVQLKVMMSWKDSKAHIMFFCLNG